MIHRIEPFFPTWRVKNWTLLFNMTQRIEPFQKTCLIKFLSKIFKELNLLLSMTQRIELFLNMTPKIDFFWTWFTEMNLFSALLEGWNIWQYDSKNWTFFDLTQRIEPSVLHDSKNWTFFTRGIYFFFFKFGSKNWFFQNFTSNYWPFFWIWLTELNLFSNMTHRIEPFLKILTHRDWTLLFNMSQRTVVSQNSKNWTFFSQISRRIELFQKKKKKGLTELNHFSRWLTELNPAF